jgi:hypothetical protein
MEQVRMNRDRLSQVVIANNLKPETATLANKKVFIAPMTGAGMATITAPNLPMMPAKMRKPQQK